jgi:outer membrane protein insertion porin family
LAGRFITGYGGKTVPPFDRYYMGGEEDIRGFDSWSISPIIYMPSLANVNVLNNDGSQRQQRTVDPTTGVLTFANVTQSIPIYRIVSTGGDTKVVMNLEYRIPIRGPVTLALFADGGANVLMFRNQLNPSALPIDILNSEFPYAGFTRQPPLQAGTQKIRMSSGVEVQVLLPRIKAPLRFYVAYNSSAYQGVVHGPQVADRQLFPNTATYQSALGLENAPLRERRFMVRFSIGRTFGGRR